MITSHFPANLTVRPGEKVNLKCEAVGNPVPVVYWELQHNVNIDGEVEAIFLILFKPKIIFDSTADALRYERNHILSVDASRIPKPSSLTYTCLAKNSMGSHQKNITLNLIGKIFL